MNKHYIAMLVTAGFAGGVLGFYGLTVLDWGFYVVTGICGVNYSLGRSSK
tara:strand:+ start:62066 stop:62215 length:150 start_codon:yes stop_codon:yes gene_type:complete